jgi:hypothetical protein
MNVELLLAMKDAEHHNEQRRLSKSNLSRRQTTTNLIDGLAPYVIPHAKKFVHCDFSNNEVPSSSQTIPVYHHNFDIDFDPILSDVCMANIETHDSDDDQLNDDQLNDDAILLNELFSSKGEQDSSSLHPYTNVSTSKFCANLIRVFRKSNLCKSYSSDMLKLIHTVLPQPNNLPTSLNALLQYIHGKLSVLIKHQNCHS